MKTTNKQKTTASHGADKANAGSSAAKKTRARKTGAKSKIEVAKAQIRKLKDSAPELFEIIDAAAYELSLWDIDGDTQGYTEVNRLIGLFS